MAAAVCNRSYLCLWDRVTERKRRGEKRREERRGKKQREEGRGEGPRAQIKERERNQREGVKVSVDNERETQTERREQSQWCSHTALRYTEGDVLAVGGGTSQSNDICLTLKNHWLRGMIF